MAQIAIDKERMAAFCRRHRIRCLALYGSVLRPDFRPDSEIDVLVACEPGAVPGLCGIARPEERIRNNASTAKTAVAWGWRRSRD